MSNQSNKDIKVGTIAAETTFENFEQILLIDAGSDGFKIAGSDAVAGVIPTSHDIVIGGSGTKLVSSLTISAPESGTLNVTYVLYK